MSDLFESVELQMQEDAKEKNPRSAILASQIETEKRFGNFIEENFNRVSIIEKEIKEVTDKYSYKYDVDPQMVYEETVSYLTKNAIAFDTVEEDEVGILPGIRESLELMVENGFGELAQQWEDRVASMSVEEQVGIYPEVVDSFVEAVESSPQTEMWEMDPNQYEDWDKTSSAHKDLSDEELLNQIKEEVSKLRRLDDPISDRLDELHQELWDRSGHGEKRKNRKKEDSGEEKTAAGNYVAYQIKGNNHFLCPHCAQEMTGEDLNWEDTLTGISTSEMQDIAKYTGHSNKCDQCGMDLSEQQKQSAFYDDWDVSGLDEQFPVDAENLPYGDDYESARIREAIRRNMPVLGRIHDLAMESGHERLANDVNPMKLYMLGDNEGIGALNQYTADVARKLWEVLKGDKRPEQRAFYQQNKDELVDLMTKANSLAFESDPTRVSKRETAVARFIGIEDVFIQKEAMQIYSGPIWDEVKKRWRAAPGAGESLFGGGLHYEIPGTPGLGPQGQEIPEATWHDYIMRSNLYGNKPYPARKKQQIDVDEGFPPGRDGLPPVGGDDDDDDLSPRVLTGDRGTNVKITHLTSLEERMLEVYMNKGLNEKYASIIVESVGEMAQLQMDAPGLPVADSECETVDSNKEIGGAEGDKYQNWNVADKQKALDAEHQDFTDFGEPVREFVQPGGEAPYSENTKKKIDQGAESVDMNKKKVKQEDNAPKN